ncbi:hypothetical protein K474DRAFT_343223 [Panus rudis PR-1116 ss-1]|nr:hypothetical protein K474DRAFT_343223 [Panus rudis PR-1116 ss-1]
MKPPKLTLVAPADITLRSSDGEDFRVCRNNLETCSEGFIGPPSCANSEVVWLTESSDVLRLLLQFMGQDLKVPDLKTLPFAKLAELSEAVEKYQVHKAIDICESHIENAAAQPIEVLTYALKHDHRSTADAAARETIRMEVSDVLNTLPPEYHVYWVSRYVVCA